MRKSRLLIALTVPGLLVIAAPARATTGAGATWPMDEPPGANVMHDTAGYANNGSVPASVTTGGGFYHFNGTGAVTVPSQAELNPGSRDFDVTVTFRWKKRYSQMSLLQKGTYNQAGGQYKINITNATVACRVNKNIARVSDPLPLNTWHTIGCHKRATKIYLTIDGRVRQTLNVAVGSVGSVGNLHIGGKTYCPKGDCDLFIGDLADASISYP